MKICFKNVEKRFYEKSGFFSKSVRFQLKSVNFKLESGKTLAIIGESGSGKTTVAKLAASMIKPDAGEIVLDGFKREDIKYIFQNPHSSLNPRMSIFETLKEPLDIFTSLRAKEKDDVIFDTLSLLMLENLDVRSTQSSLSGGEKQRIALARALLSGAKMLILDEPVSALDVTIQAHLLNLLKDLQVKKSLTYIFITHDISVASFMSDEIIVMKNGEQVEWGPSSEIIADPKSDYTRELIEASALGV